MAIPSTPQTVCRLLGSCRNVDAHYCYLLFWFQIRKVVVSESECVRVATDISLIVDHVNEVVRLVEQVLVLVEIDRSEPVLVVLRLILQVVFVGSALATSLVLSILETLFRLLSVLPLLLLSLFLFLSLSLTFFFLLAFGSLFYGAIPAVSVAGSSLDRLVI